MADIVVDNKGVIHVAYYRDQPEWEVRYTQSTDGGRHWTTPHVIHRAPSGNVLNRIVLKIDARDRLHMVWYDELKTGGNERGGTVFYVRSTDHGKTWNQPLVVDQKDERYIRGYGAGEITVGVVDDDTVMLTWAGPPASQRWYQVSQDGGDTWSQPALVAPMDVLGGQGLRNYNWGMDLAADSAGRLHLVTSGDSGLVHLEWRVNSWLPPQIVYWDNTEWQRIAVSLGNTVCIVGVLWPPEGSGSIPQVIFTDWQSDAPQVQAEPVPTTIPKAAESAVAVTVAPTRMPVPTPTTELHVSTMDSRSAGAGDLSADPITLGLGAVVLSMSIVVAASLRGRRRSGG